jgi:hypothetical protein
MGLAMVSGSRSVTLKIKKYDLESIAIIYLQFF